MRARRRRHGGASKAGRGAATEPQLYVPFPTATPDADVRLGAARIPGYARTTASSARAAPPGGGTLSTRSLPAAATFPEGGIDGRRGSRQCAPGATSAPTSLCPFYGLTCTPYGVVI